MALSKKVRQQVYEMCNGKCAYCGKELNGKFQVDHVIAYWHTMSEAEYLRHFKKPKPSNYIDNFLPSCARCNKWKSTFTVEQFRQEIELQVQRLNAYHSNYRMALDYGLIKETIKPVVFYFETLTQR